MSYKLHPIQREIEAFQARVSACASLLEQGTAQALEEAEIAIMRLHQEYPNSHFPHALWGVLYFVREQHHDAITSTLRAIELNPNASWLYLNLSSAWRGLSDYANARQEAKRAIVHAQTPEEEARAYIGLSRAHMEEYHFAMAGRALDKASELVQPPLEEFYIAMFMWLVATGDIEGAISFCRTFDFASGVSGLEYITPPAQGSLSHALGPLFDFVRDALQEGHSPEQILNSLDLPPDEQAPGTPEYIDGWRNELHDPLWRESASATLRLLSVPGLEGELLAGLHEKGLAPLEAALRDAPMGEELSEEEELAQQEALEDFRTGQAISHEELLRDLDLEQ